jgi:hypothetical protein
MGKYVASVRGPLALPARVLLTTGQEAIARQIGRAAPTAVPVRFLIDTGSGRSTLLPSIIADLNPISRGAVRIETSLGVGESNLYWIRLEFPGARLAPIPELAVARLALPASLRAFHGLIGRDLLERWDFVLFEGRRGRLTIRDKPGGLFGWFRG